MLDISPNTVGRTWWWISYVPSIMHLYFQFYTISISNPFPHCVFFPPTVSLFQLTLQHIYRIFNTCSNVEIVGLIACRPSLIMLKHEEVFFLLYLYFTGQVRNRFLLTITAWQGTKASYREWVQGLKYHQQHVLKVKALHPSVLYYYHIKMH